MSSGQWITIYTYMLELKIAHCPLVATVHRRRSHSLCSGQWPQVGRGRTDRRTDPHIEMRGRI